jgi:hypothetical protein
MVLYGDVFAALNARGVRYVVVGGMAVLLRGHPRMTVDLDLVVDLEAEPARAAIEVLLGLGFKPRLPVAATDFADASVRATWVERRNLQVFPMYDPADAFREVDLFASYPMPFDDLLARAGAVDIGPVFAVVACIDDLIRLKSVTGRPQDAADVAALERLRATGIDHD